MTRNYRLLSLLIPTLALGGAAEGAPPSFENHKALPTKIAAKVFHRFGRTHHPAVEGQLQALFGPKLRISVKKPGSMARKLERKQGEEQTTLAAQLNTIPDLLRGRLLFDGHPASLSRIIEPLERALAAGELRLLAIKDRAPEPELAYLGHDLIRRLVRAARRGGQQPKVSAGHKAKNSRGYTSAYLLFESAAGVPFELQIGGRETSALSSLTHVYYDLSVGRHPALTPHLLHEIVAAYESLSPDERVALDAYQHHLNRNARRMELGHDSTETKLPAHLPDKLDAATLASGLLQKR